jgi:hypothetical protein
MEYVVESVNTFEINILDGISKRHRFMRDFFAVYNIMMQVSEIISITDRG